MRGATRTRALLAITASLGVGLLAACEMTSGRTEHDGPFTIVWAPSVRIPDDHQNPALYYRSRRVAPSINNYSACPTAPVILYEHVVGLHTDVWLFDGRSGQNAPVPGASWPMPNELHWSGDCTYVAIDHSMQGILVVDAQQRRLFGPLVETSTYEQASFTGWTTDRSFEVKIDHNPDARDPRWEWVETLTVNVDPYEVRRADGTLKWP